MSITLEWIGHSCVIIRSPEKTIIIDPFLDSNPNTRKTVKDIENIDFILLTHGHWDHIAEAMPLSLKTNSPIICVPELAFLLKKMGNVKILEMGIGGKMNLNTNPENNSLINIQMVSALHSSSVDYEGMKCYAGLAAGFLITITLPNHTSICIYHAGDTALTQEFKTLQNKVDIALLPIDGHYNMGIEDTNHAIEWIQPKVVIPIHYNTFPAITADPSQLENPYGKVVVLDTTNPVLHLGNGI